MAKSRRKQMGNPPAFEDPGMLQPGNKDSDVRFNPVGGRGAGTPAFSEGTRFGTVPSKDPAVRFNPKKP